MLPCFGPLTEPGQSALRPELRDDLAQEFRAALRLSAQA
jgi:hypothetical protein